MSVAPGQQPSMRSTSESPAGMLSGTEVWITKRILTNQTESVIVEVADGCTVTRFDVATENSAGDIRKMSLDSLDAEGNLLETLIPWQACGTRNSGFSQSSYTPKAFDVITTATKFRINLRTTPAYCSIGGLAVCRAFGFSAASLRIWGDTGVAVRGMMGVYEWTRRARRSTAHSPKRGKGVYSLKGASGVHLYQGTNEKWYITTSTATMVAGKSSCWIMSTTASPSPLGLTWRYADGKGGFRLNPPLMVERASFPMAVRVTGASGGGMKSNGVYTFTGKYQNEKPSYTNGNGYSLAYETLAMKAPLPANGNWGATNLAKADAWTITGDGHHRYYIASDSPTPPLVEWNLREERFGGGSATIELVTKP